MSIAALHLDDEAGFDQLVAIYLNAIDPSEQKTTAALRLMLGRDTQRFLVARAGGAVVGFAILWLPRNEDIWSLEYLAVAPAYRGSGLGARIFRASTAAADRPFGIIEVEAPSTQMRRRRISFYGHLGCRRIGTFSYLLPLDARRAPPPMWLLLHGPACIADIARQQVRGWLSHMYAQIYAQAEDDPRIAQMLAGEGPRVPLNALPATP